MLWCAVKDSVTFLDSGTQGKVNNNKRLIDLTFIQSTLIGEREKNIFLYVFLPNIFYKISTFHLMKTTIYVPSVYMNLGLGFGVTMNQDKSV